MQVEKLILSIPERSCNICRSHPKKYFFGVLPHFKTEPLKELQPSPQHIYKDKTYKKIISKYAFQI